MSFDKETQLGQSILVFTSYFVLLQGSHSFINSNLLIRTFVILCPYFKKGISIFRFSFFSSLCPFLPYWASSKRPEERVTRICPRVKPSHINISIVESVVKENTLSLKTKRIVGTLPPLQLTDKTPPPFSGDPPVTEGVQTVNDLRG